MNSEANTCHGSTDSKQKPSVSTCPTCQQSQLTEKCTWKRRSDFEIKYVHCCTRPSQPLVKHHWLMIRLFGVASHLCHHNSHELCTNCLGTGGQSYKNEPNRNGTLSLLFHFLYGHLLIRMNKLSPISWTDISYFVVSLSVLNFYKIYSNVWIPGLFISQMISCL